jgi:hypothetical protein
VQCAIVAPRAVGGKASERDNFCRAGSALTWVEKDSLALLAKSIMHSLLSRFRVILAPSARVTRISLGVSVAWLCPLHALRAEPSVAANAPPAAAPEPLPVAELLLIKQRLVPFETLQGRFEQQKRIAKIKRPLESRGRFTLVRGKGVLWRTEAPIQSLLTLTADALSVVQDQNTVVSISLDEQPGLRFLAQTLFAVFMTDVQQIQQGFTVLGARAPQKPAPWSLSLRPREAAVARLMREIDLTGREHIESIEIFERNGDSTLIRLHSPDSRSPLPGEDALLLERTAGKP